MIRRVSEHRKGDGAMTLGDMKIGASARIENVGGDGALRQHFLDMGIIPGAEVTLVKLAPLGDPIELRIHGYELTVRLDDARKIGVIPVEKEESPAPRRAAKKREHPALGEPGIHHVKGSGDPLPDDHVFSFALVGNQNSGKTTLFNQLTGSNQHVGNFPGVTVDVATQIRSLQIFLAFIRCPRIPAKN